MEVIRTLGSVMGSIKMLVNLIEVNKKRRCKLARDLKSMNMDFEILIGVRLRIKDEQAPAMQLQLQELAYDMDDFMQGLSVPGELGSFIPTTIGLDTRPGLIDRVEDFKKRIQNLKEELPRSFESISSGGTCAPAAAGGSSSDGSPIPYYAKEVVLVGIEGPKKEIVELLSPRVKPHLGRLSVISIVGRSGSGKTALARALYEDDAVTKDFDFKSWVVASDSSSVDILNKIRHEVVPGSTPKQDLITKILGLPRLLASASWSSSSKDLQHFPKNKRYLVFVDDVQQGTTCEEIKNAFHENEMDSRIIVTTSVPSVAMQCSSGSFVYTMQGLDKENSRELFRREFRGNDGYSQQDKYRLGDKDVDVIVDKCDGLPIALISAAECLRGKKRIQLKGNDFIKVSQDLGDNLACSESDFELYKKRNGNETTFAQMRRALVEPYENLLNNGDKECLLYGSIFPSGYQISSKNLVRILMAEGLGPGDPHIMKDSKFVVGDVCDCLRMLMDQHMIEPVPIRSNCNAAKRCRIHSIMLQFTIKKAVSRNLVSLIHKGKSLYNDAGRVRRLTIQSSSDAQCTGCLEEMDLSVLRSLAIFDKGIVNFKNCKLVRVLNLEGCIGLTQKDLDNICGLLFLKYLSLRKTGIQELPKNVKKLRCLETLDTRDTVVIKLPVEVIMLPQFAYLFGKFELTELGKNMKELDKFFKGNKSKLQTLGGIAVRETESLEIVLLAVEHATKLRKVKVWYTDTPSSTGPVTTSTPELLCAGPSADALDPTLTISRPLANGTPEPIACANGQGMFTYKKNPFEFFSKRKPSAGPASNASSNTYDTAPATSTPVAGGTPETFPWDSRLAETLKKRSVGLESMSVDFNGVPNTSLDFLQTIGTISSIKLRKGLGSLPGPDELGDVCNLKKLHLFSTGLKSEQLASLQHLKCLQYLKLAEEGRGLWDSEFHVQERGFISLFWLCFESSNSKPPPLKIDEGVTTPLASLLLLCKESRPRVEGISHLAKLNEVILHSSASDDVVTAWKEEAKKHINRPYVEKKQD